MSVVARMLVAAAVLVLAAPRVQAQSSPLVGAWTIEYQRGLSNENGEVTPIMGTGHLEVTQKGDSLIGTLTPTGQSDGPARPPLRFAGAAVGATATLTGTSTARINMNGEEQIVQSTITWTFRANGDVLTGTMLRAIPGHEMGGEPSPVKGTREK
jgi:hypothetical protein